MAQLHELLEGYETLSPVPEGVEITGLAEDSRLVRPGDLYFAIVHGVDRYQFLDEVVSRGAVAVIGTKHGIELPIPHIQVADDRAALAHISAAFYDHPARQLTMIGVTGTDGKTTTANFIYEILQAAGHPTGMISTVNALIGDQVLDTGFHVTTPEAFDTQRYLRQMVDAGLTHAVLEMTSIGLAQQRGARPAEFDIAVVTNITHEHLDSHGDYEGYFEAKARLVDGLAQPTEKARPVNRLALVNRDDRSYAGLAARKGMDKLAYGLTEESDLYAVDIENRPSGLRFRVQGHGLDFPVQSSLFGEYNVYNALAAIGATVVGLGVEPAAAQAGIAALSGVPGRMEHIDLGQEFGAIVDFAHTPFALEATLKAGRQIAEGRLIAVFGSAGLRDKAKRHMMAEVSAGLADLSVFTAEDPRSESLDDILAEMAAGAEGKGGVEGKTFWRVPDRGEAIRFALEQAQPSDLVMVLGKGHEQSMCFGDTEYPWDDRVAMRAALAECLGVDGPEMPLLPTSQGKAT